MRFIHAADIHLDSPLRRLEQYAGAPVDEIRGATQRALENLVELAIQQQVDFVLIAGDLYDGDWKDHNTGLFFVSQMARLREADIPVVMISGNHDAANKMTRSLRLPENVELLGHSRPHIAASPKLHELGVAVHGRSFAKPAELENMALDYPAADRGCFNIGLLHTSLSGAQGHEPYAPCSVDQLEQKQYDYWALGHVHTRQVRCDDRPIVFCGNLQGRHIREPGAKGCYLVTVDGGGEPQLEFQPLDVFRWRVCQISAAPARHADDLPELFGTQLSQLTREEAGMPLAVRVVVTGSSPAHQQLVANQGDWTNQLRAVAVDVAAGNVWIEKVEFCTVPPRKLDDDALRDGPIGQLLQYCSQLRESDQQLLELATELDDLRRKLPEELIRGNELPSLQNADGLRQWLNEVEPLLVNRLVETLPQ